MAQLPPGNAARAQRAWKAIWNRDARFFGAAGKPPPNITFNDPTVRSGPAETWQEATGRVVHAGTTGTSQLARLTPKQIKQGGKAVANVALWVDHELARIFQSEAVFSSPDPQIGAGTANGIANRIAHFHNTGKGNPAAYARKHFPYFGQDPRTTGATPPTPAPAAPPPQLPGSATPASLDTDIDRRAKRMSTEALQRVVRNGMARGDLRGAAMREITKRAQKGRRRR